MNQKNNFDLTKKPYDFPSKNKFDIRLSKCQNDSTLFFL